MQHERGPDAGVIEIHKEVPGLLRHSGMDWALRGSANADPAATVLDDGQDVVRHARGAGTDIRADRVTLPGPTPR
jgi:hypothetical protein